MTHIKTELGKTALQDRSLGLTPRQRSVFIMFDGKRSDEEVLKLTTALGVTAEDVDRLVTLGLLAALDTNATKRQPELASFVASASAATETASAPVAHPSPSANGQGPALSDQAQYAKAYPIAVKLTSNLGLRGFRLNLAVESAGDLEKLKDLAPKIKEAVGVEKFKELENALYR